MRKTALDTPYYRHWAMPEGSRVVQHKGRLRQECPFTPYLCARKDPLVSIRLAYFGVAFLHTTMLRPLDPMPRGSDGLHAVCTQ